MMKAGSNFKELRQSAGITQKQVAEAVGVSPSMICEFECGKKFPAYRTICDMLDAISVNRFRRDAFMEHLMRDIFERWKGSDDDAQLIGHARIKCGPVKPLEPPEI